jgi:hypothetical protein
MLDTARAAENGPIAAAIERRYGAAGWSKITGGEIKTPFRWFAGRAARG